MPRHAKYIMMCQQLLAVGLELPKKPKPKQKNPPNQKTTENTTNILVGL